MARWIGAGGTVGAGEGGGVSESFVTTAVTTSVVAHAADEDPHEAAGYAILADGGRRIFTRDTSPIAEMEEGDIWLGPWGEA